MNKKIRDLALWSAVFVVGGLFFVLFAKAIIGGSMIDVVNVLNVTAVP